MRTASKENTDHQSKGLTWSTAVNKGPQCFAILPVLIEVCDWQVRNFVLDPAQQPLLRGLLLCIIITFILPHWHGNGVVKDKGPYQAKDQLQVSINYGFTIWKTKDIQLVISHPKGKSHVFKILCLHSCPGNQGQENRPRSLQVLAQAETQFFMPCIRQEEIEECKDSVLSSCLESSVLSKGGVTCP